MNIMDKKDLYNKIMRQVSVEVKKALNESENETFKTQNELYNKLVKQYKQYSKILSDDVLINIYQQLINEIENGELNKIDEGECCYSTGANTIGMGEVIPAGINTIGSGDRFDMPAAKIATKKSKKKSLK